MYSLISSSGRAGWLPAAIILALAAATPMAAQTVTYTFDGGSYTSGTSTPLVNAAPDLDPANVSFFATFDAATTGAFIVSNSNFTTGTGFSLFEPNDKDALLVTLSVAVTSLSLDFAIDGVPNASSLVLTDGNGGMMTYPGGGSGLFATGSLTYTSATPFTSFGLQGLTQFSPPPSAVGVPQAASFVNAQIDTDNFVFAIPEPGANVAVLLAAGVMFVGARRMTRVRVEQPRVG